MAYQLQYSVSAPGKIILHGEHSVVYGKPAIAGPINLRTYFNVSKNNETNLTFKYSNLNFECILPFENMKVFFKEVDCLDLTPIVFLNKLREDHEIVFKYIEFTSQKEISSSMKYSVGVTMYLLNRIFKCEKVEQVDLGAQIEITSDLSIGAGIGSSASFGVCVAAGFYMMTQKIKKTNYDFKKFKFCEESLKKITNWAFDSEIIMHERPSGIDNTISTYGNLIKFRRGHDVVNINACNSLNILIVDSDVSRSTSKLVKDVSILTNRFPLVVHSIFDTISNIVDEAEKTLPLEDHFKMYNDLKQLFDINNNMLRAIGVSHEKLECIFKIAESHGFSSKITGAGGGGCVIILLPPNYNEMSNFKSLCNDLTQNNFFWKYAEVGGVGVEFKEI